MTDEPKEPTSMADEVTQRVIAALRPAFGSIDDRFDELTGELRAAKKDLGEDIGAINAKMTNDRASIDDQLSGLKEEMSVLRKDINRHTSTTKSILDSHTARFRTIDTKLNELKDQNRAIIGRHERSGVVLAE